MRIIVNERLLLGDDVTDSDKLIWKLDKYVSRYFSTRYQLIDFGLSGVILAVDINVHNHDDVLAYLKVLHRIGRVKRGSPSYYECFDDDMSFCLDGNSNGIQFLIYDLENLIKSQLGRTDIGRKKLKSIATEAQGILRAEVRLTKPKVIRSYTNKTDILGQIAELSKNSQNVFMDTFTHIIPFGDFYKKDKAMEIVRKEVKNSTLRRKMLQLLVSIPEKKSLYLAQKAMSCRDMEKVMDAFAKINLSPVTISKRQDTRYLKNLYSFVLS